MDTLLMIFGGMFGLALALPFLALALARFNLFWTIIEEGTVKIILLNGQYHKAKMRYRGFYLDEEGNVIRKKEKEKEHNRQWQKYFNWSGGLAWVGIWPFYKIHTYDFRWQVLKRELDEKTGKMMKNVEGREEVLDYIFVKASTYFTKLEKAETKGMLPADSEFIFVIRITNPYRALFRAHQWFEFTINILLPHLRHFQATRTFEELVIMFQLKGGEIYQFLEETKALNEQQKEQIRKELAKQGKSDEEINEEMAKQELGVLGFLRKIYGITVEAVKIESVDAEERYEQALSKEREAELEAKRITIVNKAIAQYGEQAVFLIYAEAIETASKGSGNTIIPLGLAPLLKEVASFIANPKKIRGGGGK